MDVDVSPEPSPPEREAIAVAVERLVEPRGAHLTALYDSPWRLAGVRENAAAWPESLRRLRESLAQRGEASL